jgi:hypothetical protein
MIQYMPVSYTSTLIILLAIIIIYSLIAGQPPCCGEFHS